MQANNERPHRQDRYWLDLNSVRRYPLWRNFSERHTGAPRRFCEDCQRLRKCWTWRDVVRCAECSEKAGAPTIRDAWMSAMTRQQDHRDTVRYTRERAGKPLCGHVSALSR